MPRPSTGKGQVRIFGSQFECLLSRGQQLPCPGRAKSEVVRAKVLANDSQIKRYMAKRWTPARPITSVRGDKAR